MKQFNRLFEIQIRFSLYLWNNSFNNQNPFDACGTWTRLIINFVEIRIQFVIWIKNVSSAFVCFSVWRCYTSLASGLNAIPIIIEYKQWTHIFLREIISVFSVLTDFVLLYALMCFDITKANGSKFIRSNLILIEWSDEANISSK